MSLYGWLTSVPIALVAVKAGKAVLPRRRRSSTVGQTPTLGPAEGPPVEV